MAREWVRLGHEVTIVAASYSHVRSRQPEISGSVTEEFMEGIRYLWLLTPEYQGNGIKRFLNMLAFVWRLFLLSNKLTREMRPDVVIASSTYPLDIYPGRAIAKVAQAKLIFEVHDLWPLSPMELGRMSKRHPFIMLMQAAENYAYRVADSVVSMLPMAKEHMQEHGMKEHKFIYIPNGIVVDEWQRDVFPLPKEQRNQLECLKEQGSFLVGYAGGHGLSNALDQLIIAATLLTDSSISFVLVGKGPEKKSLQQKVTRLGLTNVVFLDPVPKASIPMLLSFFDVLYLGWKDNPLYRFGICPNKLIDYMMAAKPVIHAVDAGNDLVAESGCGISVSPQDSKAISEAVIQLMQTNSETRAHMGKKGRDYVLAHHDYKTLARLFLEVMK
jgi:glycosyltransferase involved in cell wall biosynthesis